MIYFGNPVSEEIRACMRAGLLGTITTPAQGNAVPAGALWVADNGLGPGQGGKAGQGQLPDHEWFDWVSSRPWPKRDCRFAVAPDVVGNAAATLTRSRHWLGALRSVGYPAAFVAQDGLEDLRTPWDDFDALFIGGSTEWKLGRHAYELVQEGRRRGKWVHFGRVNTKNRLTYAYQIGCDSVDGTTLARGPVRNLESLLRWLRELEHEARPSI